MAWKNFTLKELADHLNLDYKEVSEKHRLISVIKKRRQELKYTQEDLARVLNISQSRIAKIESGLGTKNVSFDLLFRILTALGFECKVVLAKPKSRFRVA